MNSRQTFSNMRICLGAFIILKKIINVLYRALKNENEALVVLFNKQYFQ